MIELNQTDLAAALAHRACCGTEHDPQNGKLHGYCIVCGIEWPCETARFFLRELPKDPNPQWTPEQIAAAVRLAPWVLKPIINVIPPGPYVPPEQRGALPEVVPDSVLKDAGALPGQ